MLRDKTVPGRVLPSTAPGNPAAAFHQPHRQLHTLPSPLTPSLQRGRRGPRGQPGCTQALSRLPPCCARPPLPPRQQPRPRCRSPRRGTGTGRPRALQLGRLSSPSRRAGGGEGKAEPGGPSTSPPRGGERGSRAARLPSASLEPAGFPPEEQPAAPLRPAVPHRILGSGGGSSSRSPPGGFIKGRGGERQGGRGPRGTKGRAAASGGSAPTASWPRLLRRGGRRMPRAPAPPRRPRPAPPLPGRGAAGRAAPHSGCGFASPSPPCAFHGAVSREEGRQEREAAGAEVSPAEVGEGPGGTAAGLGRQHREKK